MEGIVDDEATNITSLRKHQNDSRNSGVQHSTDAQRATFFVAPAPKALDMHTAAFPCDQATGIQLEKPAVPATNPDQNSSDSDEDGYNLSQNQHKVNVHFCQQFSSLDTMDNEVIKKQWLDDAKLSRTGSLKLHVIDNEHYLTQTSPKIENDMLMTTLERKTPWRKWTNTSVYCQPCQYIDTSNLKKVTEIVQESNRGNKSAPLFDAIHLTPPLFDNNAILPDVVACISAIAHNNLTTLILDLEIFAVDTTGPIVKRDSLQNVRHLKISLFSNRCPPRAAKFLSMFLNCWGIAESVTKNAPNVTELILNWLVPYSLAASSSIPHSMDIASHPTTLSLAAYGGIKEMCSMCMASLPHGSLKTLSVILAYPDTPNCIAFAEQLISSQSKSLEFLNVQLRFETVRTRNVCRVFNLPRMTRLETLQLMDDVVEIEMTIMDQLKDLHLRLTNERKQGWRTKLLRTLYFDENRKLFNYNLLPKLVNIVLYDK